MNKETTIAIPADPNDPEDFDVSVAGVERAHMGRRIRKLRNRLGMSQQEFARAFGIPASSFANTRSAATCRRRRCGLTSR